MSTLGVLEGRRHLHCPRCGTHRIECGYDGDGAQITHDTVPALVRGCREFHRACVQPSGRKAEDLWVGFGIRNSINLPGDRP